MNKITTITIIILSLSLISCATNTYEENEQKETPEKMLSFYNIRMSPDIVLEANKKIITYGHLKIQATGLTIL